MCSRESRLFDVSVTVIKRGGPNDPAHTRTLEGWNHDKKTGWLTVKEMVDNEREMVLVYGKRKVPWAWQMQGAISDVNVLIGKEAAVRGEDYMSTRPREPCSSSRRSTARRASTTTSAMGTATSP